MPKNTFHFESLFWVTLHIFVPNMKTRARQGFRQPRSLLSRKPPFLNSKMRIIHETPFSLFYTKKIYVFLVLRIAFQPSARNSPLRAEMCHA